MKSAREWIDTFPPPISAGFQVAAWLNSAQIEAIQTDARAGLQSELAVAVELLEGSNPTEMKLVGKEHIRTSVNEHLAWYKRRDAFLKRVKEKEQ